MTHLHDHAQVPDVGALGLDELHDHAVQVGERRAGRHAPAHHRGRTLQPLAAEASSGRGFLDLVVVVVVVHEAPPLGVLSVLGRAQVQVHATGRAGARGQRGDQAGGAAAAGLGGRGRGGALITAEGGGGQVGGLCGEEGGGGGNSEETFKSAAAAGV